MITLIRVVVSIPEVEVAIGSLVPACIATPEYTIQMELHKWMNNIHTSMTSKGIPTMFYLEGITAHRMRGVLIGDTFLLQRHIRLVAGQQ